METNYYKELESIVYSKNTEEEYSQANHSFCCFKDIEDGEHGARTKPPREINIAGNEKVSRYFDLYEKLYNSLGVKKYKMSLTAFRKKSEQLFFTRSFNKENVESILKQSTCSKYVNIFKIYGIELSGDVLSLGDFKLIKKEHIVKYLGQTVKQTAKNGEDIKSLLKNKAQEAASAVPFVYFVYEYCSADSVYSREITEKYLSDVVNVIRYMIGWRGGKTYVGTVSDNAVWQRSDQICATGQILFKSEIIQRDVVLDLCHPYFNDPKAGNEQIWQLVCKENKNDLEKRIFKAIRWVGVSIEEPELEVACTELAFAFEALLKQDGSAAINPSIQGQISESLAFICGSNAKDRMKIIDDFRVFYSYRSAIAHGYEKKEDVSYQKYLNLLKIAIVHLIVDDEFKACTSLSALNEVIKLKKYTCGGDKE